MKSTHRNVRRALDVLEDWRLDGIAEDGAIVARLTLKRPVLVNRLISSRRSRTSSRCRSATSPSRSFAVWAVPCRS